MAYPNNKENNNKILKIFIPKREYLFDTLAFKILDGKIIISHNGILVDNNSTIPLLTFSNSSYNQYFFTGIIQFSDKLRPNLALSRESIISIPWVLWSGLLYTIRRNLSLNSKKFIKININVEFDFFELNKDTLLIDKEFWAKEKIFNYYEKSLFDILDSNAKSVEVFTRDLSSEEEILKKKIIELYSNYKITLFKDKNNKEGRILKKASIEKHNIIIKNNYPPLTFCEYENFNGLMPEQMDNQIFNIKHPFSLWLISSYDYLFDNYSNHLHMLTKENDLMKINSILSVLRKSLPDEYKPPKELVLTVEDFLVETNLLPEYC